MKRIYSAILAIVVLIGTTLPVQAAPAENYTAETVTISSSTSIGRSYVTYSKKAEADKNPIIYYANKEDFPIVVVVCSAEDKTQEYSFDSYGVKRVSNYYYTDMLWRSHYVYATINIEPYPVEEGTLLIDDNAIEEALTEDEIIDHKLDQLLDKLDLGFYNDAATPYGKELRAFLTGEWDGSTIYGNNAEDSYAGYTAYRGVTNRTYRWNGTNLLTGETCLKEVSVDYVGYNEIIGGCISSQDYSLIVSRTNGTFEQWRLLEKIDSWVLPDDAGTINQIFLTGKNSDDAEEIQAVVYTIDGEGEEHMYSLLPSGVVRKTI